MPVSETAQCNRTLPAAMLRLDVQVYFAVLGELDGVADEIDDDLPQAARVADQRRRHFGPDAENNSSPFSRRGEHCVASPIRRGD